MRSRLVWRTLLASAWICSFRGRNPGRDGPGPSDRIHPPRGPNGGVRPTRDRHGRPRIGESPTMATPIRELLGSEADGLLTHVCKTIPRESLHLPGPDFVDRIFAPSDRNPRVLCNLQ